MEKIKLSNGVEMPLLGYGVLLVPPQEALRWLTQRGIVAIPKSSHKERMEQNLNIFDFKLSSEEMAQIATMNQHDTGTINFQDPQFVKYLIETYG